MIWLDFFTAARHTPQLMVFIKDSIKSLYQNRIFAINKL